MGVNEGFAIAARSQLANISAFTDTMTNVNTTISVANTALQSLSRSAARCRAARPARRRTLEQHRPDHRAAERAARNCRRCVGILNTQVGDRYLFSGSAINTPSVASADRYLNGTATQAGLKQVIAERAQADSAPAASVASSSRRRPRPRCRSARGRRRLAVRPEAQFGVVVADRRDRDRSRRLAGGDFGRPRRHQSQPRRPGQLHVQSA